MRSFDRRRLLTGTLAILGAALCLLWTLAHTVRIEERAAGIRLTFTTPQATSLRAQWDTGAGYDASPPILIMLPSGPNRTATVPLPVVSTRSLRISFPVPGASQLTEAAWFFKAPNHATPVSKDRFTDVSTRDPREYPGTRFQLDDSPSTRARLRWQWSWQILVGAGGMFLLLTAAGWAFIGAPGVIARLRALTPFLRWVGASWLRWGSPIAAALSLTTAVTGLLSMLRRPPFCDEGDNFVGGTILAQGGSMYRDFYSQHPPFVYHLVSLFAAMGVHSTEGFRIGWVVFLSAIWLAIYFTYRRDFGSEFLCIVVLGYTFCSVSYLTGHVLSDGSHAFGLLIVWLECLRFRGLSSMPPGRMLWLGCALFMTIMSAAVSLYALLPLGLTFAWKEWRLGGAQPLRNRLRHASLALALVLAPFAAFAICYALTGNLGAFYQQAYVFNRTVYPRYIEDYGGNPWLHYLKPPRALLSYLQAEFGRSWQGQLSWVEALPWGLACTAIVTVVTVHRRTPLLGVGLLAVLIMSGDRGFQPYFHAQPFLVMCLATVGVMILGALQHGKKRGWSTALVGGLALVLLQQNLASAQQTLKQSIEKGSATPYDDWILHHTAPNDTVWQSELTPQLYINTGRRPASRVVDLVPWFYQAYKDQILADLAANRPKVIIMDPMRSVWGHYPRVYAPELLKYIEEHYAKPPAAARAPQHLWMLKAANQPTAGDPALNAPKLTSGT